MRSLEEVAQLFCAYFYKLFDSPGDRSARLAGLYRDRSTLTCEEEGPFTGPDQILAKLNLLNASVQ